MIMVVEADISVAGHSWWIAFHESPRNSPVTEIAGSWKKAISGSILCIVRADDPITCHHWQSHFGPKATWLVWGLRFFFLDLPFPPSPVWVVLGAEQGCFRAAGASFDQLPEAFGAVGVRSACDLPPGGSDRGFLPRSTSSSERWC
ncbi:hypothetical protein ACOSQ4_005711 [Xanthoceras sorbifolium]